MKKNFFDQTQNHDLIISPKRKNAALEMALKSFIISKLEYQTSKCRKKSAAHELETTSLVECATLCVKSEVMLTNNDNDDLSLSKLAQIFQIPLNWFACRLEKKELL